MLFPFFAFLCCDVVDGGRNGDERADKGLPQKRHDDTNTEIEDSNGGDVIKKQPCCLFVGLLDCSLFVC